MHLITRLGGILREHPRWAALLLGAIAAFGFQPWRLWPLTILAVAALIALLTRATTARQAALLGWLFGWGHFSVGNTWIATAFTYQANMPAWLGMIAVMLLSIYLALFPALATLAAWTLAKPSGGQRLWAGALLVPCWIVGEWLRSWVLSGFAWNPLGVALLGGFDTPGLAALTPWIGTYGLSGLLVGLAALLLAGIRQLPRWRAAGGAALTLGIIATGFAMEWPATPTPVPATALAFTLIQPDIRQEVLDDPRFYESAFVQTAALSAAPHPGERRLLLWPESGLPDYLQDGYPQGYYEATTFAADPRLARQRLGRIAGANGLLLTGTVDLAMAQGRVFAARNTVTALSANGLILGEYAKAHLVPFGEYLPFRGLLEPLGMARLVPGDLDFLPGPGPRTLDLGPWGKAGLQLCYEITFSGQVVDETHRPDYIFNPSNDGWFGSWGPPQHLAQARLRAIEEGLPLLRSTTTGISAVVDADGIVRNSIARLTVGRIDGRMPSAKPPTLFSRYGNALPLIIAGLLLIISQVAMRYRRH